MEAQPFPGWVVGPWFGAGLGLTILHGSVPSIMKLAALESAFDLGIEIRVSRAWGIGAYAAMDVLLTDPYEVDSNYGYSTPIVGSLGTRVAGRF
jgi:hypothetical protein